MSQTDAPAFSSSLVGRSTNDRDDAAAVPGLASPAKKRRGGGLIKGLGAASNGSAAPGKGGLKEEDLLPRGLSSPAKKMGRRLF